MCSSQWSSCRDQTGCSRCESADRWVAAEGGVAAGSVVVGQPAVQGGGALVVGCPGGGVGPLGLQGAVEPFGLAVGPRAAGLDEPAGDAQLGADSDAGPGLGEGRGGKRGKFW